MAAAQPIAFPSSDNNDIFMGTGSFTGQQGSLNPASYTRRFLGSPISWRAGSFGSRFYPGVSPGQLLGPLDPNEFKFGRMSSSIESDHGSIVNAFSAFERQDELCRDYQCCGLNLTDLHALVEHFEECHVVVVDPYAPQVPMTPVAPQPQASYLSEARGVPAPMYHQGSFDPDDMELDMDHTSAPSSGAPSPPDTPVSTPLSAYPSSSIYGGSAPASTCSSPHPAPISAFDTTTVLPSRSGHSSLAVAFSPAMRSSITGQEPFNAYAYSDYSTLLPGAHAPSAMPTTAASQDSSQSDPNHYAMRSTCLPPALLLNDSMGSTHDSTPASSRVTSPAPATSTFRSAAQPSTSTATANQTARASTTLSRPATSLLLSKPFRCPKPNCNKSYKQANGLKYHMTHGSCNFAPPKDLEHIQALLASKRKDQDGEVISDAELREVEKEAERRLRPYACGIGECQRRYKNMNGLRYHYQHSGDHGAIGLALLASGQHECLQHNKSHSTHSSRHSTPSTASASNTSSPLATPSISRAPSATSYVTASVLPPSYQSVSMVPPAYGVQQEQLGAPINAVPSYLMSK
ncbi:hypothetical protein BKA93DRAFT_820678 [Sparassis latifolia]